MRVLQSDAWDVQSLAGNHVDWNTLQIPEASLIRAPKKFMCQLGSELAMGPGPWRARLR